MIKITYTQNQIRTNLDSALCIPVIVNNLEDDQCIEIVLSTYINQFLAYIDTHLKQYHPSYESIAGYEFAVQWAPPYLNMWINYLEYKEGEKFSHHILYAFRFPFITSPYGCTQINPTQMDVMICTETGTAGRHDTQDTPSSMSIKHICQGVDPQPLAIELVFNTLSTAIVSNTVTPRSDQSNITYAFDETLKGVRFVQKR